MPAVIKLKASLMLITITMSWPPSESLTVSEREGQTERSLVGRLPFPKGITLQLISKGEKYA